MIIIAEVEGRTCPVFICNSCGRVIDDSSRGLAVWNVYGRTPSGGLEQSEIQHVHIGECDRSLIDLRTGRRYRFNRALKRFTDELMSNLDETIPPATVTR